MKKSIFGLFFSLTICIVAHATELRKVSEEQALITCQKAIKQASLDRETAVVPDVGAMKGGSDWRYLWNAKSRMVRLRNGLGLEVGVIAMCVVDENSGLIKLLILDGKKLVAPS